MNYIDVRSDTVTWPTEAMRVAMASAPVGDDVYGDDPTVNELERLAAEMMGKEAAIFVPSGTFGNQLALFTWCPRGSEVILGEQCHIIQHEAGAASVIAGVQTRPIFAPDGILSVDEIEARIRGEDIHYPSTTLICLENAHSSGRVISLDSMKEVAALAKRYGLPIHLDGARLFNAAIALGVRAADIAAQVDSVMFCLSKGLCAPVGSMLAGPRDFIEKARRKRKIMGGGMRQVGILAAAGLVALKEMTGRLAEDHENARYLADRLGALPGLEVDTEALDINMVFFRLPAGADGEALTAHLKANGVLINPPELGLCRFVTHYWIDRPAIDRVFALMQEFFAKS
ncbi:MAG: low-specificity L-threonine aldolase [Rectinema sp.]